MPALRSAAKSISLLFGSWGLGLLVAHRMVVPGTRFSNASTQTVCLIEAPQFGVRRNECPIAWDEAGTGRQCACRRVDRLFHVALVKVDMGKRSQWARRTRWPT